LGFEAFLLAMTFMRPNEVFAFTIMPSERMPRYETRFITFGKIINMLGTYYSFLLLYVLLCVDAQTDFLRVFIFRSTTTVSVKWPCLDCWVSFA
jgi:hypothetical protein